jgi:hypothetical protein
MKRQAQPTLMPSHIESNIPNIHEKKTRDQQLKRPNNPRMTPSGREQRQSVAAIRSRKSDHGFHPESRWSGLSHDNASNKGSDTQKSHHHRHWHH